jgi:hypothetical protein
VKLKQALATAELVRKVGPETPAQEALVTLAAAYLELTTNPPPKEPLLSDAECTARVLRAMRAKGIKIPNKS